MKASAPEAGRACSVCSMSAGSCDAVTIAVVRELPPNALLSSIVSRDSWKLQPHEEAQNRPAEAGTGAWRDVPAARRR